MNTTLNDDEAKYLLAYINDVLIPSSEEFMKLLANNQVMLHHAFSFNAILAHAIDYMVFLAKKMGAATRIAYIKEFDEKYNVSGAIHISNKFRLLDAINNSFKHVELDKNTSRYKDLIETYGELTFHSLKSNNGKVYFEMPTYKFDYGRVILRPIAVIFDCQLQSTKDVIDFIKGNRKGSFCYESFDNLYEYEPWDAIDRMIDYCNPQCMNCGEYQNCECSSYNYASIKGESKPNTDPKFEFKSVMSEISGTREWST
ncbi:MAG: hypothetical protein NTY39_04335 [Campylobacterales bacterium]|nr:hypothetical protein [Campylobacterales bacterium]